LALRRSALPGLFAVAAIVIGSAATPGAARAGDEIPSAPTATATATTTAIASTTTTATATATTTASTTASTTTTTTATATIDAPSDAARAPEARREAVLAFGYGALVAPSGIDVYTLTDTAEHTTALDGISVDVLRRVEYFSYGARFWRMGGSSDGRGGAAHVLTRLSTQARFHPWTLRTLEPWVGIELGLALAEDFAVWAKTDQEAAHRAVVGVRPAFAGGLEAGVQLRLGTLLALGLRGGLLYMGFDTTNEKVAESPAAAKFFVRPTDYGQRIWLSTALTAELTVPD
jgi:hypothetical protein